MSQQQAFHTPVSHPKVLVVDDEELIRVVVADILQGNGIACCTAANGVEALRACETMRPDLILLDIAMPEMDGIETCRRIKANPAWASIPVIALSGQEDVRTVVQMLEAGSLLYLLKPVSAQRLLATLRLVLA